MRIFVHVFLEQTTGKNDRDNRVASRFIMRATLFFKKIVARILLLVMCSKLCACKARF